MLGAKWFTTVLLLAPMAAQAAIDVEDITALSLDVLAIGAAWLGVEIALKGVKLLRRTL